MSKELPIETLESLLDCDFDTGICVWKERPLYLCRDEKDQKRINARYAGRIAGSRALHFKSRNKHEKRVKIDIFGRKYNYPRVLWALYHKEWPPKHLFIDHINGNALDNRIDNLRLVTNAENKRNGTKHSHNTSGVTGVSFHKATNKWSVKIGFNGESYHLGVFTDFEAAVAARKEAEKKYDYHENHGRDKINAKG